MILPNIGGMMNKELEPGVWVDLHEPVFGYRRAELVEECWPKWMLRTSSGYEFYLYEDEFDLSKY